MSEKEKLIEKLYSGILDFLSYSARTKKEVTNKLNYLLRKLSHEKIEDIDGVVESVIERLEIAGFIDDEDYVKRYIEGLILSPKSKSKREAEMFLYKKGIVADTIGKYIDELGDDLENKSLAALVEKKTRFVKNMRDPLSRNKLIRYFISRGFDPEKVRAEVDKIAPLK